MPAKTITVTSKTKEGLKKQVNRAIKDSAERGMIYIKKGYKEKNVKRIKGGYKIDILVHS